MPDPVTATTFWDILKAIVEHPYAPVSLAIFLAFVAAVIHIVLSTKVRGAKNAYKQTEELIRNLRNANQIVHAENIKLANKLEECTDLLNRLDAKYELLQEQVDECQNKN